MPGLHVDGVLPADQFTVHEGVTRREFLEGFATVNESLHFGGKPNTTISPMALVKRAHAHVVTCRNNVGSSLLLRSTKGIVPSNMRTIQSPSCESKRPTITESLALEISLCKLK